jgi:hypothetical protein
VRAGEASLADLSTLLESAGLSLAARKKTRTVLNRLWLEPRAEQIGFVDRGVALFQSKSSAPAAALHWGVTIATYPFFGKVAELVGRLTSLHGDCSAAELHRRMSETYGEREGTYRMTNMVLQTQADWGAIERVEKGKRLIRCPVTRIQSEDVVIWLLEASLRYAGRPTPVTALSSAPAIYPYGSGSSLAYLVANSSHLDLKADGAGRHLVALREA